jgi:hypothetical protein
MQWWCLDCGKGFKLPSVIAYKYKGRLYLTKSYYAGSACSNKQKERKITV